MSVDGGVAGDESEDEPDDEEPVVVGGDDGRGPRVRVGVGVGLGVLLCCGVGVGDGAAAGLLPAGALFAGPVIAARLLTALPPVPVLLPGAELAAELARALLELLGWALMRPADWLGAAVLPALCVVPGAAAD